MEDSILKHLIKRKPREKTLIELANEMVYLGAKSDNSTPVTRVHDIETHADAGTAWQDQHFYENDEQAAANGGRKTVAQKRTIEVTNHQIAILTARKKPRFNLLDPNTWNFK